MLVLRLAGASFQIIQSVTASVPQSSAKSVDIQMSANLFQTKECHIGSNQEEFANRFYQTFAVQSVSNEAMTNLYCERKEHALCDTLISTTTNTYIGTLGHPTASYNTKTPFLRFSTGLCSRKNRLNAQHGRN